MTCPRVKELFSAEVWSDFEARFPPLPPSRLEVIEGLEGLNGPLTLDCMASLLHQMPHHSHAATAEEDWVYNVCSALSEPHPTSSLTTLNTDNNLSFTLFKRDLIPTEPHEAWFSNQIWGPIVDGAVHCLPGIQALRGEVACLATRQQRNQELVDGRAKPRQRVAPGPREIMSSISRWRG